ncbi:hypothetical protein pb186bvf_009315 [Paramecium bursaria]
MIAESFTTMNPLWKAFKVDVNEAFSFIRTKLVTCAILPMSHILMDENKKIVACGIQADMRLLQETKAQHIKYLPKNGNKFFEFLNGVEEELEKEIWSVYYNPSETQYALYAAVDEKISSMNVATFLFNAILLNVKIMGIKDGYARVTNPISLKMLLNFGGTIKSKVSVEVEEIGLKKTDIFLVHLDVSKLRPYRSLL